MFSFYCKLTEPHIIWKEKVKDGFLILGNFQASLCGTALIDNCKPLLDLNILFDVERCPVGALYHLFFGNNIVVFLLYLQICMYVFYDASTFLGLQMTPQIAFNLNCP